MTDLRLTTGTFFALIVESLRDEAQNRNLSPTKKGPLSNTEVYKSLMKVVGYDVETPDSTLNVNVSRFKNCTIAGGSGIPFKDSSFLESVKIKKDSEYDSMQALMEDFIYKHISPDKATLLGRRLLELAYKDPAIDDHGWLTPVEEVVLSQLLLDCWLYAILEVPNNKEGADTISKWMPKEKGSRAKAIFTDSIGKNEFADVEVIYGTTKEDIEVILDFKVGQMSYVPTPAPVVGKAETLLPAEVVDQAAVAATTHLLEQRKVLDEILDEKTINPVLRYLERTRKHYSTIKTLIYQDEPHSFYSFYEVADIQKAGRNMPIIQDLDARKLQDLPKYLVITGTGGLGKSMMARHLLLNSITYFDEIQQIPLLVLLKDLKVSEKNLLDYCYDKFCEISPIDRKVFEDLLLEGKFLLFFDGYDELKSKETSNFDSQLNQLITRFPENRYILTSRPYSSFAQLSKLTTYWLRPLTKEKAINLVKNLEFRLEEPEIKKRFLALIDDEIYSTHKAFIENPLLLTILVLSFDMFADLPTSMAQFYENAYDALAWKHDRLKGGFKRYLQTGLTPKEFKEKFAEFSAYTFSDEIYEFSENSLKDIFEEVQLQSPIHSSVTLENFSYDSVNNLCLLVKEGLRYSFVHRSFQEYFTAYYIAEILDYRDWYEHALAINEEHTDSAYNIFQFLYEMKKEKVEQYIIKPYLSDILSGTGYEDGYEKYLLEFWPTIDYFVGDIGGYEVEIVPESPLLEFIKETLRIETVIYEENMPNVDREFVIETYFEYQFGEYYDGEVFLTNESDIFMEGDEPEFSEQIDDDPCGEVISIDTELILDRPGNYPSIYKAIMDDGFKIKEEFYKLKSYLRRLSLLADRKRTNLLKGRKRNRGSQTI